MMRPYLRRYATDRSLTLLLVALRECSNTYGASFLVFCFLGRERHLVRKRLLMMQTEPSPARNVFCFRLELGMPVTDRLRHEI